MAIKIDTSSVENMFKRLDIMPTEIMKEGYRVFRKNTPIQGGNARNRTKLEDPQRIGARYGYADRLDSGWSSQSPQGMTRPTSQALDQEVGKYIKRID